MFGPNPPDSASATECTPGKDFPDFSKVGAASLQMDRSRSSGGVGWSIGYWGIVIGTCAPRGARFWTSGITPDTFSDQIHLDV